MKDIIGQVCKKSVTVIAAAVLLITGSISVEAKESAASKDISSYSAFQITEDMAVGWNLGNSLDAMNKQKGYCYDTETIWGNPVTTKENIDAVAQAGFGAVRIPVSWYNHIDSDGQIDSKWLARVGEVVNYALDNNLYVIINIHHDAGMDQKFNWIYADTDSYEEDKRNFSALWTQIAAYFKDYDEHLLFEATNEIMNTDRNWDWGIAWKDFRVVHDLDQEFINIVRASGGHNSNRCLVLSTWAASSDSCQIEQLFYKKFTDTVEDKLIMSVHNYTTTDSRIENLMIHLGKYSKKYQIPVIIDEFGSTGSMQLSAREAAAEKYVSAAKQEGIVCFWWDDGGQYILLNRKTNQFAYPTIVDILIKSAGVNDEDINRDKDNTSRENDSTSEESGNKDNVSKDNDNHDNNGDNSGNATVKEKEAVKVSRLTIKSPSKKLAAGGNVELELLVTPKNADNKAVTWRTSNKKYAEVDKNGKVILKKAGIGKTVTITATAKDGSGKKAACKIRIMKHAVKSIQIKAPAKTLKAGKTMKLKATVKTTGKSANKTLNWQSSNTKYATVSKSGKVKAKTIGKGKAVTITVTSTDGSNKKAKIKIKIK